MLGHALRFAGVWLSPAALLGLAPLLLDDGSRGLWPPVLLATAGCLTAILLAAPWAALPSGLRPSLVDLLRYRAPASGALLLPLGIAAVGSALLFLWAQLAAARQLARVGGWSEWVTVGLTVLALLLMSWREGIGRRVALVGSAAAVVGLLLPLGEVLVFTDPAWPRVFHAVASRPRLAFDARGPWTLGGRPIRGTGSEVVLRVTEEQRLLLVGPGRVRIEPGEGGAWSRQVAAASELSVRPGDRVVVPDGFPIRFQAGRAIPDAPASGPDWLDAGVGPGSRPDLAGLALTILVGALGLTAAQAALPIGGGRDGAASLGAGLASVGLAAGALWSLYVAWLTPEVYVGGVVGGEVYELPAHVPALGSAAPALRDVALAGLAGGGLAAGLAALATVPRDPGRAGKGTGWDAGSGAVVTLLAGLLAASVPVGPWPLLVAALGLAASACAPAVLVACWGERVDARALAGGAVAGLSVFGALTAARLAGLGTPSPAWLGWLARWPALGGVPLNALVVWLLTPGPRPTRRTPVPPALAALH